MKLSSKRVIFFITSIYLLSFSEYSFSQSATLSAEEINSSKNLHYQLLNELEGAYQVQMINNRCNPVIDTDLLNKIKDDQMEHEQVVFYYKDNIRIKILSKSEVSNGIIFSENEIIVYVME